MENIYILPRSWLKRDMKVKVFPNRNGMMKIGLRGLLSLEGLPFDGPDIVAALHPAKTGVDELREDYENIKRQLKKTKNCIQEVGSQGECFRGRILHLRPVPHLVCQAIRPFHNPVALTPRTNTLPSCRCPLKTVH